MKVKHYVYILVLLVLAYSGYRYLYQEHRDISAATADFTIKATALKEAFATNQEEATSAYINKVIQIEDTVLSASANALTLKGVSVALTEVLTQEQRKALVNTVQTIKGRCIGYDDLLEEVRIDQAIIISN